MRKTTCQEMAVQCAPSASHDLACPSLHRASAAAGATFDAERTLAPVIDAIVGIVGQVWPHGLLPDMRPALGPVSAPLQTGAAALATRFACCLADGRVAGSDHRTGDEKADQQSSTHGFAPSGMATSPAQRRFALLTPNQPLH
jgi:hypothetical protein